MRYLLLSFLLFTCCSDNTGNTVHGYNGSAGGTQRELVYKSGDGWVIHASFFHAYKKGRPLLISIHMLMSDRSYYPVRAAMVEKYNVLKIDMRGHGDSLLYRNRETRWRSGRGNIYRGSFNDIRAGIREVKRLFGADVDTSRIFLQGSSYSCVLILQYFMKYPDNIRGLIFMSPGDSYGQSIVKSYSRMLRGKRRVPVVHVCSRKDFYCNKKTAAMERTFKNAGKILMKKGISSGKYRHTLFFMEDEHVHGTHFFYTHRRKYPAVIISWMDSLVD